jgi:hypothetical protein
MRIFGQIVTVFMLLWSVFPYHFPRIDIGIVGPLTSSAFRCLKSIISSPSDEMYVYVRGYHSTYQAAGLDINAASTMISASKGGLTPALYIEVCRKGDPATQVNAVYDLFASLLSDSI